MGQFGISMIFSKVDSIATWPVSTTHREVQVFLRFANFYCHFILDFNEVASGVNDLLSGDTKRKFKSVKFVMIKEALDSFNELKQLFIHISMLVHYDLTRRIMLKCDASGFAISAILS